MGHRVHYLQPCFCFVSNIIRLHFAPVLAVSVLLSFQLQTQATRKGLSCFQCPLLCRYSFNCLFAFFFVRFLNFNVSCTKNFSSRNYFENISTDEIIQPRGKTTFSLTYQAITIKVTIGQMTHPLGY